MPSLIKLQGEISNALNLKVRKLTNRFRNNNTRDIKNNNERLKKEKTEGMIRKVFMNVEQKAAEELELEIKIFNNKKQIFQKSKLL